ncbi:hypothetical protein [Tsukamurella spumae]|uniref:Uncharacterized protein n=1 Tax=Tsukamurella spumae TaxID=44753 RepID=A0A846X4K3_9ACTN|nr:hypothetical protein [Tsukamurella spumae]NKY20428.1 hypothetical protein [Tsukamurella spumae]
MQDRSPEPTVLDGARLPTDRRTLLAVAAGGAVAAVLVSELSSAAAWRDTEFDVRLLGLAVLSLATGALFGVRDRLGPRVFGLLVFGVLASFSSVGVYALVGLLAMPPAAGVRFLFAAPVVAGLATAAGAWSVRRIRR